MRNPLTRSARQAQHALRSDTGAPQLFLEKDPAAATAPYPVTEAGRWIDGHHARHLAGLHDIALPHPGDSPETASVRRGLVHALDLLDATRWRLGEVTHDRDALDAAAGRLVTAIRGLREQLADAAVRITGLEATVAALRMPPQPPAAPVVVVQDCDTGAPWRPTGL